MMRLAQRLKVVLVKGTPAISDWYDVIDYLSGRYVSLLATQSAQRLFLKLYQSSFLPSLLPVEGSLTSRVEITLSILFSGT